MPSKADLFWRRVHARASALVPESTRDFLRAFDVLRTNLTGRQIEAWIAAGAVDRLIAYALTDADFATAFSGYRARIQLVTRDAAAYFGKDIPGVPAKTVGVAFDYLNPRVVDAVRQLDSKMMQTLATDTRQTVRDIIQKGLESGAGPRQTARALRDVLELAPNQLAAITNFERSLRGVGSAGSPFTRALRDRRFDAMIRKSEIKSVVAPMLAEIRGIRITADVLGFYSGQMDGQIVAYSGNDVVAILDYTKYDGELKVKFVQVRPEFRRRGISTGLYDKMRAANPGVPLTTATTTPEGTAFRKAYNKKLGGLTEAQVEKMVDAYRRKMIAFNAETNARTATLDAFKLGQELSWQDAKDKGLLGERDVLVKQWKGVMDDREREEHIAMEGETVPIDSPYSNGEMIPGESTYNCRCLSIVYARMA